MQISGSISGCLSVPKTLVFRMCFIGSIGEPNTSVEFLPFLQLYFQSGFTAMFLLQSEAGKLNADCITGQIIFFACSAYLWDFLTSVLRFSFFCVAEGASSSSD